jgi:chemotaxis protein CheX
VTTDLHNSFFEATKNVFQMMLDLSLDAGSPSKDDSPDDAQDIVVGVTGDLTGEIVYHFPNRTSLGMVSIMSGMEVEAVDEFVTSAISEIANIISGNVMTLLEGENVRCDILPPELKDSGCDRLTDAALCFVTRIGGMCLDIRLNPTK